MANSKSSSISKAELEDLKQLGYVEGNPLTIPENISPVLKAKIQAAYNEANDLQTAQDLPTATERQNQMVRERAAANGDKDMQKLTGVEEGANVSGRQGETASGQASKSDAKK